MRNIFDQYGQNENKLTHALVSALHQDSALRNDFIKKHLTGSNAPPIASNVCVTEQAYPGQYPFSDEEAEERGIPDIWFFDLNAKWCAVVECKVTSNLTSHQVQRHINTARKRGFDRVIPVTITVAPARVSLPNNVIQILWSEVFAWLDGYPKSRSWPYLAARYFEILEGRMVQNEQFKEGKLTRFTGFPFSDPGNYSYLEAKRVLGLALDELRGDKNLIHATGMNPDLNGRKAITGQGEDMVWDYLKTNAATENDAHTKHIHLTLAIERRYVEPMITVPDKLIAPARKRFRNLRAHGFLHLLESVEKNLRSVCEDEPGGAPTLYVVQRRYPTQRSAPFHDAVITVDLRTAVDNPSRVKRQPQWIEAAYSAIANSNSNLQMGIGMVFPYNRCPKMSSKEALLLISKTWIACSPIINALHPKN